MPTSPHSVSPRSSPSRLSAGCGARASFSDAWAWLASPWWDSWAAIRIAAGHRHQAAFRDREALWTYEKNLPHPSILAFESYAKAMLLKAQAAPDHSPLRRQYLESAVATAREGVQYYRSIAWKPTPGYVGRERIQLASLFSVLGLATELGGGSLEQQLELCRAAFQIAPADYPTATLASVLLAIAKREPRDLKMAHESLRHFHDHVRYASRDRLQVASLRAQLREYSALFPALSAEVAAIEQESLR